MLCLTLSAVAKSHSGRSIRSVRRPEAKCTRRRAVMGAASSVITSRAGVSMPGVFKPCSKADCCSMQARCEVKAHLCQAGPVTSEKILKGTQEVGLYSHYHYIYPTDQCAPWLAACDPSIAALHPVQEP